LACCASILLPCSSAAAFNCSSARCGSSSCKIVRRILDVSQKQGGCTRTKTTYQDKSRTQEYCKQCKMLLMKASLNYTSLDAFVLGKKACGLFQELSLRRKQHTSKVNAPKREALDKACWIIVIHKNTHAARTPIDATSQALWHCVQDYTATYATTCMA
jgi:hypothetical protein